MVPRHEMLYEEQHLLLLTQTSTSNQARKQYSKIAQIVVMGRWYDGAMLDSSRFKFLFCDAKLICNITLVFSEHVSTQPQSSH